MNIEEEFKEVVPEEDTNSVEDEEISHSTNEDKIIPKKSKNLTTKREEFFSLL